MQDGGLVEWHAAADVDRALALLHHLHRQEQHAYSNETEKLSKEKITVVIGSLSQYLWGSMMWHGCYSSFN